VTDFGKVIDLRGLPRDVPGRRASIVSGVTLFIVIEAVVVATLLTSYYYLRVMVRGCWPPAGIDPPDLAGPIASSVVLVASLVPILVGRRLHRSRRTVPFRAAAGLGVALLLLYLGLAFHDLLSLPFDWRGHVYGSLVWTLNGYQIFHVIALLLVAAGVTLLGAPPHGLPRDAAVTVLVMYWVFVVAVAIPSYFTVYLSPHLF
jgi:cytochrome c oxidase subunit III